MDYGNDLYFGINEGLQNAAAKAIDKKYKHDHIDSDIITLHWLTIKRRIVFKLVLLAHKSLLGLFTCIKLKWFFNRISVFFILYGYHNLSSIIFTTDSNCFSNDGFIVFDIKLSNTAEYKFSLIVVYELQVNIIIIILYNVW